MKRCESSDDLQQFIKDSISESPELSPRDVCAYCFEGIKPKTWLSISLGLLGENFFCKYSCMWYYSHPDNKRTFTDMSESALRLRKEKKKQNKHSGGP